MQYKYVKIYNIHATKGGLCPECDKHIKICCTEEDILSELDNKMNGKIPWTEYEAILLVDAYLKVKNGEITKSKAVSVLSIILRAYGKETQNSIDDTYRNENGISMRMSEIACLFNNKTGGLSKTSLLFEDTVNLCKTDSRKFAEKLKEAREALYLNNSNKALFVDWLTSWKSSSFSAEDICVIFDKISKYCKSHYPLEKPLLQIEDCNEYYARARRILNSDNLRLCYYELSANFEKVYLTYTYFLNDKTKTSVPTQTLTADKTKNSAPTQTLPADKTKNSAPTQTLPADKTKNSAPTQTLTADKTKNSAPTQTLPADKTVNPATPPTNQPFRDLLPLEDSVYITLKAICDNNKNVGTTSYDLSKRLHIPKRNLENLLNTVPWVKIRNREVYTFNYDAVLGNKRYNFEYPKSLAFTKPVSLTYFDETTIKAPSWRRLYVDFLAVLYDDYPSVIKAFVWQPSGNSSIPFIADKNGVGQMRSPYEFVKGLFVETYRTARDVMFNIKKLLDECNIDCNNVVVLYEERKEKVSLPKTETAPQKPVQENKDIQKNIPPQQNTDKRTEFARWLYKNPIKNYTPNSIIAAMDEASNYCVAKGLCDTPLWDIQDEAEFNKVTAKLLSSKIFRFIFHSLAVTLDKAFPLYTKFAWPNQAPKDDAPVRLKEEVVTAPVQPKEVTSPKIEPKTETATAPVQPKEVTSPKIEPKAKTDTVPVQPKTEVVPIPAQIKKETSPEPINIKKRQAESDNGEILLDFSDMFDLSFSKPTKLFYKDLTFTDFNDWANMYAKFASLLKHDYPEIIVDRLSLSKGTALEFAKYPEGLRTPKRISDDLYVEVNHSAPVIAKRIDALIDLCGVNRHEVEIYYVRKKNSNTAQNDAETAKLYDTLYDISRIYTDPNGVPFSKIINLLKGRFNEELARNILDNVPWAKKLDDDTYMFSEYRVSRNKEETTAPLTPLQKIAQSKFSRISPDEFAEMADRNISDDEPPLQETEPQTEEPQSEFDKEKYIEVLTSRYRNGITFDSIDFDNFREYYEEFNDCSITVDDDVLEKQLLLCGVFYNERLLGRPSNKYEMRNIFLFCDKITA